MCCKFDCFPIVLVAFSVAGLLICDTSAIQRILQFQHFIKNTIMKFGVEWSKTCEETKFTLEYIPHQIQLIESVKEASTL